MTLCGPARDTVLSNQQTGKLNFDPNYIIINMHVYVKCRNSQVGYVSCMHRKSFKYT